MTTPNAKVIIQNVEPLTGTPGWAVDIEDYEALGLYDTSSRWFPTYTEAVAFAEDLSAILIIPLAPGIVVVS